MNELTFQYALYCTLHHEGGFVDDPDDPGGATYRGVSLRFLRSIGEDIDGDGDVDYDDIIALTRAEPDRIASIYREQFWLPNRLHELQSELIAVKAFDMCVNLGGRKAWKLIQRAARSGVEHLKVDGIVGPKTIGAVNSLASTDYRLLAMIRQQQADFYGRLIHSRPRLAKFELGWLRRAAQ